MGTKAGTAFRYALFSWTFFACLSCSSPAVSDFAFTLPDGSRADLGQAAGKAEGEQGSLQAGNPGRLSFVCGVTVPARAGGLSFFVTVVENTLPAIDLVLTGARSESRYALPADYPDFTYYVPVETGFALRGFSLEARGDAPAHSCRITAAGIAARFIGIDAAKASVRLSFGAVTYRPSDDPSRLLSVSIDLAKAGLTRGNPYRIAYSYRSRQAGAVGIFSSAGPAASSNLSFLSRSGPASVTIYEAMLPADTAAVSLIPPPGTTLVSLVAERRDSGSEPIEADLGSVLIYDEAAWRDADFELFRWDRLPEVLVFDTRDYAVQDAFFKRVAFFVEKSGYAGRLWKDSDIAALHGWNAHDYRAEDLAAFFAKADAEGFPLGDYEKRLRGILLSAGIIRSGAGRVVAGTGSIISVSRETAGDLRARLLRHESYHGLYFAYPEYRTFVAAEWKKLDPAIRKLVLAFFAYSRYDVADRYLVENEFQAYFLQQSPAKIAEYFEKNVIGQLVAAHPERKAEFADFIVANGKALVAEETALARFVSENYGFPGGSTILVGKP
jgi:hypothetical protein